MPVNDTEYDTDHGAWIRKVKKINSRGLSLEKTNSKAPAMRMLFNSSRLFDPGSWS